MSTYKLRIPCTIEEVGARTTPGPVDIVATVSARDLDHARSLLSEWLAETIADVDFDFEPPGRGGL